MNLTHDYCKIYRYGDRFKLVYIKTGGGGNFDGRRDGENPEKLTQSLSRARKSVYALAACNPWDYFVTLTLSADKADRSDLSQFRARLSQYVRDCRKRQGVDIKYLLIPELHKDGQAWHMHGLLSGLSDSIVRVNANGYYEWTGYVERFGYMSMSRVRSVERCAAYITKYITKSLGQRNADLGAHLYFASNGLAKEECVAIGFINNAAALNWEFENDYVKVLWSESPDFGLADFEDVVSLQFEESELVK